MAARDYAAEITAAVAAGDIAALTRIAFLLLGKVEADDDRRARQADKKRRQRDNGGRPGRPELSKDVPGQNGTSESAYSELPRSTTTIDTHPTRVRARPLAVVVDDLSPATRTAFELLRTAMAEYWPPIDGFLQRRPADTWDGWLSEMSKLTHPGSQFTPGDLAQVCSDDSALTRRIGSPYGLRKFVANARLERMENVNGNGNGNGAKHPPATAPPSRRPRATEKPIPQEQHYPPPTEGPPKWQTRSKQNPPTTP